MPQPNNHRTGNKTLKLGQTRPDPVDSVELGENKAKSGRVTA